MDIYEPISLEAATADYERALKIALENRANLPLMSNEIDLITEQGIIPAIKRVRERTGCSLLQAKNSVEHARNNLPGTYWQGVVNQLRNTVDEKSAKIRQLEQQVDIAEGKLSMVLKTTLQSLQRTEENLEHIVFRVPDQQLRQQIRQVVNDLTQLSRTLSIPLPTKDKGEEDDACSTTPW